MIDDEMNRLNRWGVNAQIHVCRVVCEHQTVIRRFEHNLNRRQYRGEVSKRVDSR